MSIATGSCRYGRAPRRVAALLGERYVPNRGCASRDLPASARRVPEVHDVRAGAAAAAVTLDSEAGGGEAALEGAVGLLGPHRQHAARRERGARERQRGRAIERIVAGLGGGV